MTKLDRGVRTIAVALAMVLFLAGSSTTVGATKPALTVTEVEEIVAEIKATYESAQVQLEELPDSPWSAGLDLTESDHWWVEAKLDSAWQTFDPLLNGP